MKYTYMIFFPLFVSWSSLPAQLLPGEYTEEHVRKLREELDALKLGNIELQKEIDKQAKDLEASDIANSALRATIRSKNAIIALLEENYKAAETRAEKEKIRREQIEELRRKDSIRNAIIIADLQEDKKKLQELYDQAEADYKSQIRRLERRLFELTFRAAALLRSQPPETVDTVSLFTLDRANSMGVKARHVKKLFIVFETGKDDYELPDYTFSLSYFGKKGVWEDHFKDANLPLNNGVAKHEVEWGKSLIPKAKALKGDYKLVIAYEEDQELQTKAYYFRLD